MKRSDAEKTIKPDVKSALELLGYLEQDLHTLIDPRNGPLLSIAAKGMRYQIDRIQRCLRGQE